MRHRIGWRGISAVLAFFLVLLLSWTTLYPEGSPLGTEWQPDSFRRVRMRQPGWEEELSNAPNKRAFCESIGVRNTKSVSKGVVPVAIPEMHEGVGQQNVEKQNRTVVRRRRHRRRRSAVIQNPYPFSPAENPFLGDENLTPTAFDFLVPPELKQAKTTVCNGCRYATCKQKCKMHGELMALLRGQSASDARLHIIPVDPLAMLRKRTGRTDSYVKQLHRFAAAVKSNPGYLTFKGSDHVFVCLSSSCSELIEELGAALAAGLGTRAIFAGVDVATQGLKWPCPLRVINVSTADIGGVDQTLTAIVKRATFMIEKRNRWICSDQKHPSNHWDEATSVRNLGGAFMEEFGFSLCLIPKCGSSMTVVLLRRMMHYGDWNQYSNGINHGPSSGIRYLGLEKNASLIEAISEDLSFVKGAVVRHPITRLLSGYLDKIYQKKEYGRVNGIRRCFSKAAPPTFAEFVEMLLAKSPNPNVIDKHFRMQSAFCNMRNDRVDFIAKQATLADEMEEFGKSIGFWDAYGASGFGANGTDSFGEKSYQTRTHDSKSLIWNYYTEDLMMRVYKYYKEDFERFSFSIDEILATNPARQTSV